MKKKLIVFAVLAAMTLSLAACGEKEVSSSISISIPEISLTSPSETPEVGEPTVTVVDPTETPAPTETPNPNAAPETGSGEPKTAIGAGKDKSSDAPAETPAPTETPTPEPTETPAPTETQNPELDTTYLSEAAALYFTKLLEEEGAGTLPRVFVYDKSENYVEFQLYYETGSLMSKLMDVCFFSASVYSYEQINGADLNAVYQNFTNLDFTSSRVETAGDPDAEYVVLIIAFDDLTNADNIKAMVDNGIITLTGETFVGINADSYGDFLLSNNSPELDPKTLKPIG